MSDKFLNLGLANALLIIALTSCFLKGYLVYPLYVSVIILVLDFINMVLVVSVGVRYWRGRK